MLLPAEIINRMLGRDEFSKWLGIELIEEGMGYCQIKMVVRPEMCNGLGIVHGGICYSLADSALAFASNSLGKHAVSIETSISHILPVHPGDVLIAKAEKQSHSNRLAIFHVNIMNQNNELVGLFKGTVYRKETPWE